MVNLNFIQPIVIMKNLWKFLKNEISRELNINVSDIEEPLKYGDFAYPCFPLVKGDENPVKLAEKLAKEIKIDFLEVKNIGPYLNFYVKWDEFSKVLIESIDEDYGKAEKIEKKRVMVEHTSANPNKALHIGHIRNSCLGDCLSKILKFYGHDVIIANYIDDTGDQMSDLIIGFKVLNMPLTTDKKFDQYCGDDVYVKVNKIYKKREDLLEKKREITKKIEEGNNEIADFSNDIARKILLEQLKTCWRMGIYYDLLNKETDIIQSKLWLKAFEMLKKKKLIYQPTEGEKEGCWLLKLSDLPEFEGMKDADAIIQRSDGTVLYIGKDIAYAMWKHGFLADDFKYNKFTNQPNDTFLWTTTIKNPEKEHPLFNDVKRSIAVIDVRQSYYQDSVIAALKLIAKKDVDYIHYDYELVSLSLNTAKQLDIEAEGKDFVHMSGRKGLFINTDIVLDMLFKKAYDETKKRNSDAEEDWLKETSEKIAVGALRYELEKISPQKTIIFDIDESLKLEGNSAPYLQYTYTRASSLLRKAGTPKEFDLSNLKDKKEINVLKLLALYPEIIEKSVNDLRPHYIASYLYDISNTFNQFYETIPVIISEEKFKNARIKLVESVRKVIESGLNLLGIPTMEKM